MKNARAVKQVFCYTIKNKNALTSLFYWLLKFGGIKFACKFNKRFGRMDLSRLLIIKGD